MRCFRVREMSKGRMRRKSESGTRRQAEARLAQGKWPEAATKDPVPRLFVHDGDCWKAPLHVRW